MLFTISSDQTFNVLGLRHMMHMCLPSIWLCFLMRSHCSWSISKCFMLIQAIPQVATYLQSLILNLVYRVACPLCYQVVDSTCQMCWLHPQNWLAVRFLISWLTSKFVEIAKPEMLWSGHVTNIDFTGIQICSNFLSSHERILEGSDPLHIS